MKLKININKLIIIRKEIELFKLKQIFTECQEKAFDKFMEWVLDPNSKQNFVVSGHAGCVDADTEFLTENGWKKISEYVEGDSVLQYNKDGTANFVKPKQYHKYEAEYLTQFETFYGVNQCLSDEHNVVYKSQKGVLHIEPFSDIKKKHELSKFKGKFITSFNINNYKKIDLSEFEIRVICASIADGAILERKNEEKYMNMRLNLKREDKKERIKYLLKEANIPYKSGNWNPKDLCYESFCLRCPIKTKKFPKEWYSMSKEQLKIIADEVFRWDGEYNKRENNIAVGRFFTTDKDNADFIQFVFSSLGYKASLLTSNRVGRKKIVKDKIYITKTIDYIVNVTKRNLVGLTSDTREERKNTEMVKYKTRDGYKYCFTVDSGMLVLRRKDCIFITGNSGKTYLLKQILSLLEKLNLNVAVVSFTGKAVDILRQKEIYQAQTLHSLIYHVETDSNGKITGWKKRSSLDYDMIIIDEFSMLSKDMINDLSSYGMPLAYFGDSEQLPPISNPTDELIKNTNITLTTIVRQAEGNPIIHYANEIRKGKILKPTVIENNELGLFACLDKNQHVEKIERSKLGADIMICGTNKMKNMLNWEYRERKEFKGLLNPEERLMILKNNNILGFYNGQMITVKCVGEKFVDDFGYECCKIITDCGEMTISLEVLKDPCIDYNNLYKIIRNPNEEFIEPIFVGYGYAATIHKLQGSQADNCLIFGHDMWFMLYQNKDKKEGMKNFTKALYTAVTRSAKKCVLVM